MTDSNEKPGKPRLRDQVKSALGVFRKGMAVAEKSTRRDARFRQMYKHFREILSLNDYVMQLIADIEDKLFGREPFALEPIIQRVRRTAMDVFVMVKNLNQITDNRYNELYDVLRRIAADIELECPGSHRLDLGPLVIPLERLRASDAPMAGGKMAKLGEVMAGLGLLVPEGFVITSAAFSRFMTQNRLWERSSQLEGILEMYGQRTLAEACREFQEAIRKSEIPLDLENAILGAFDALAGGEPILVSMRSSAAGEDGVASHAGIYYTELNVSRELLLDSYLMVVASAYGPDAVSYRVERGLTDWDANMAVGCMRMLAPRCSGIMFSRSFKEPQADRVVISVIPGTSNWVASGKQGAEEIAVTPGEVLEGVSAHLNPSDLEHLIQASRKLEAHFGSPQDVEWAIDPAGELYILQARPMVAARVLLQEVKDPEPDREPILEGGYTACPGLAAGPVFHVLKDNDLERFPAGGVLVARHSSPTFSRVMTRCHAIVTDVGSPTGHMAILAREFGVPSIVGIKEATKALRSGQVVTVHAAACKIYEGEIPGLVDGLEGINPLADSPAIKRLQCLSRYVTPLHLIDPHSRDFTPASCQSLHDITRFIHEKVFHTMFRIGDMASQDNRSASKLKVDLPLAIQVFDLGGGIREGSGDSESLLPGDIVCQPMIALLAGLLDGRIHWSQPRPISARGFLSVLGQGMAGPPPEAQGVGSTSYAVISDRYMNFTTKAGYHFSTLDVYCGRSQNKNYIHFRFAGGGTGEERRIRRVRFISEVMSNLDFKVQLRRDNLVARLEKYDCDYISARLTDLGRLLMCSRQLDMLMDSDDSPRFFVEMFRRGEFERF